MDAAVLEAGAEAPPGVDAPVVVRAGVRVTPTTGLTTTEKGQTATFAVVLERAPTADVVIAVNSSDPSEGTAKPASLGFTSLTWASPQLVTITGIDDATRDGNVAYKITLGPAVSGDPAYDGLDPDDVNVTNTDDETPALQVAARDVGAALQTNEAGAEVYVRVTLNGRPTAAVTVPVVSSDTSEGAVSPASLTFTPDNWNAPQDVRVTGVDDNDGDGDQTYKVTVGPSASTDTGFDKLAAASLTFTNVDNENAGVTVSLPTPLATTEAGGQSTFTVVLNRKPAANVSIALSSDTPTEGTVAPASLTFTADNWNAPQTVTVTGVNDEIPDGARLYTIVTSATTSTDATYAGIDVANVSLTNTDNDTPGLSVTPGLSATTTEAGGTATFTVALTTQPGADVTITLTSSNTAEGAVSPATLVLTPANWKTAQTVTVTGVDDALADGNKVYSIKGTVTSADVAYTVLTFPDVLLVNNDNDSPGITVTPTTGLVVTEAGGTATFTVALTSRPTAPVTIALSSSDTGEGTITPATLTFSPATWNTAQMVAITGVDDDLADGNQPFTIVTATAISTDPAYGVIDPANVAVSNTDNDTPGIAFRPTVGLTTTEAAGTATVGVALTSQPAGNVTIVVSSLNTNEGTLTGLTTFTFTETNWSTPRTVNIQGVDDLIDDGDKAYALAAVVDTALTVDPAYDALPMVTVNVTNTDNDTAGFTVTPSGGTTVTTEAGGTDTFTVVLTSQPLGNVVVNVASSNTAEGTVAPAALTFTPLSWNMAQTVTATGVNDFVDDGDIGYTVQLTVNTATTLDDLYKTLDPADVSASNTDNDTFGITVNPTSGLVTTEAGGTAMFTVVLDSQPTAPVTIALSSSDTTEGTVTATPLTFTTSTWNMAQTVTVTGVDDVLVDGNIGYTIVTAPAVSTDPLYSALNASDVTASNTDDDTPPITEIRVFSVPFAGNDGDFGGRAGADTACGTAASGWAVGKTIHALQAFTMSDDIASMPTTFSFSGAVPIYDLTGANKIADTWADLTDGTIDMTLFAAGILPNGVNFWTGSTSTGTISTDTCTGFTSNSGVVNGTLGISNATGATWLVFATSGCSSNFFSLCIAY